MEATVKLFNRTAMPHSILYWANVAVHVNDDYQVIFPPSVQVATYHSKNDFSYWPIGQGRYRGTDYKGMDLSWWKNHPNAVSFFAWDLQEDFMGGYDHGRRPAWSSIGDHHIVCGAKLWEWGPEQHLGHEGADRFGRPVRGTDGRGLLGQPAGLQLDQALRGEDVQAVLVSGARDRRV